MKRTDRVRSPENSAGRRRNFWTAFRRPASVAFLLLLLVPVGLLWSGCRRRSEPSVWRLSDGRRLEQFHLEDVTGLRDGDDLRVRVAFASAAQTLSLNLHLRVGVPTRLLEGSWELAGENSGRGTVVERSLTFLGGQSDSPNLGGTFELRAADQTPRYRVHFPVLPIRKAAKGPTSSATAGLSMGAYRLD